MTLQEYQINAARTCADFGDVEKNLIHMDMGIFTETGEIVDIMKRKYVYNKDVDRIHLGEEIGDCAFYAINKLRFQEIEIQEEPFSGFEFDEDDNVEVAIFELIEDYTLQEGEDANLLIYMLKCIAHTYDLNFYDLLDKNINKLKVRFPNKFNSDDAINRDLDSEKDALK